MINIQGVLYLSRNYFLREKVPRTKTNITYKREHVSILPVSMGLTNKIHI